MHADTSGGVSVFGPSAKLRVQAHEALDGGERGGSQERENLRFRGADQPRSPGRAAGDDAVVFRVPADQRRKGTAALLVVAGEDGAVGGVEDGDDAVGGAEIDADGLADADRRGKRNVRRA